MARTAAQSAFRVAERDAALVGTDGFSEAWPKASSVPGWFGEAEASAFWSVIQQTRPRNVVEIGSYQGRSTTLLGLALKHANVVSPRLVAIDPHTGDRQLLERLGASCMPSLDMFKMHIAAAGIDDIVDVRVEKSEVVAREWSDPIDLLFVDGWHSYDAVLSDGRGFGSHLSDSGLVCFDDYGNYAEVRNAVNDVCRELGLTLYGTVVSQVWAGRADVTPSALRAVVRVNRFRRTLSTVLLGPLDLD